jgi:hypothetical protein
MCQLRQEVADALKSARPNKIKRASWETNPVWVTNSPAAISQDKLSIAKDRETPCLSPIDPQRLRLAPGGGEVLGVENDIRAA